MWRLCVVWIDAARWWKAVDAEPGGGLGLLCEACSSVRACRDEADYNKRFEDGDGVGIRRRIIGSSRSFAYLLKIREHVV